MYFHYGSNTAGFKYLMTESDRRLSFLKYN